MSLPRFPDFIRLIDVNPQEIKEMTEKLPPYSDYVYSNMWSWNLDLSFKVSTLNDNLIMYMRDPKNVEGYFTLHGTSKINETLAEMFSTFSHLHTPEIISLVPEETIYNIDTQKYIVIEDRDSFDYVYSTKDLSRLEGSQYKTKRRMLNQFLANQDTWEVTQTTLSPIVKIELLQFMSQENRKRSKLGHYPFVEHEMAALERFFLLPENENIIVSVLKIDSETVGYSVDEIVNRSFALSHFFKVAIGHKGAYDILNQMTADYLSRHDIKYWNWVEDLGIEGLRQAKMSYRPVAFLKLHTVYPR